MAVLPLRTDLMPMAARYWRYTVFRAYANLLSEASRYRLGWLWWIAEPLAMTAVFYVVFRYLRGAGEDFVYFLIVGVVAWLWFSSGAGNAAQSLTNARSLVLQVKLPKMMFPLIGVVSVTLKQVFVFAALLVVVGALMGGSSALARLAGPVRHAVAAHRRRGLQRRVPMRVAAGPAIRGGLRPAADDVLLRHFL